MREGSTRWVSGLTGYSNDAPRLDRALKLILDDAGMLWCEFKIVRQANGDTEWRADRKALSALIEPLGERLTQFKSDLTPIGNPNDPVNTLGQYLENVVTKPLPRLVTIPAVRSLRPGDNARDHAGGGLLGPLRDLQAPRGPAPQQRQQWARLNRFVSEVLETPARLEPVASDTVLQVQMNGRVVDVLSLGTGVSQTIILAVECTEVSDSLVWIEEPENNLHPHLQRRLIDYLLHDTTNQYIVTTHSATVVDTPGAEVFRVHLDETDHTVLEWVASPGSQFAVVHGLGYRASDLVQANCVVWVEGPSDRIYLNWWLQHFVAESGGAPLLEGLDYQVMFYGGRLLSNLSADDCPDDLDEFVRLQHLNRRIVLMMDSDRVKSGQRLTQSKLRVKGEIENQGGLVWITHGREVEDYVDNDQLSAAVGAVHPGAKLGSPNRYRGLKVSKDGRTLQPSKKAIASRVIENKPSLDVGDLRAMLRRLDAYIRESSVYWGRGGAAPLAVEEREANA